MTVFPMHYLERTRPRVSHSATSRNARNALRIQFPLLSDFGRQMTFQILREGAENGTRGACAPSYLARIS
jgi:hypothetical protein